MRGRAGGSRPPGERRRLRATARACGVLSWVPVIIGVGVAVLLDHGPRTEVQSQLLAVTLGLQFLFMVAHLVLTAAANPGRWTRSLALAAGLLLWAAGSAVLLSQGPPSAVTFPAPGEWLFLTAYVGVATYLVLDGGAARLSIATWLDTAIICGGAGCVAGFVEVTPVANAFDRQGLPLLIALVYPILDTALILTVVGQVALQSRRLDRRTGYLLLGLALLATADTSLVAHLASGVYDHGLVLDLTWSVAWLLVVRSASRETSPDPAVEPPSAVSGRPEVALPRDWRGVTVLAAGGVALMALTFQPPSAVRPFVVVPAVITLAVAGLRLTVALREARSAAEAFRLSLTDSLTGLPNRRALDTWLTQGLRGDTPLSLLLLDLDGFKEINDTLGHTAGDVMLRIVAGRLPAALGSGARVARLGGDEFAVLTGDDSPERVLEVARRLRDVVGDPARVDGIDIRVQASVGAALRDDDVAVGGDLLRRADVAMYQAKMKRVGILLYDRAHDEFSRSRLQIAEELRYGIERGELVVWYQPQIDTASGRPCSMEALVRWMHPTRGLQAPGAFLPVARRAGLMEALTEAVLDQVIENAVGWRAEGLVAQVAVNVAPEELLAASLVERLVELVNGAGLPPETLVVEVTEDSFLTEPERAREVIMGLRAHGLEVSIDDYGTGYSSLSYLRDLPVQELKIDRSFVAHLLSDTRSEMIVRTTNQLAHGLGSRTIAEGVEDLGTAHALRDIGVDRLQGYFFSTPLPPAEITAWWQRRLAQTSVRP